MVRFPVDPDAARDRAMYQKYCEAMADGCLKREECIYHSGKAMRKIAAIAYALGEVAPCAEADGEPCAARCFGDVCALKLALAADSDEHALLCMADIERAKKQCRGEI